MRTLALRSGDYIGFSGMSATCGSGPLTDMDLDLTAQGEREFFRRHVEQNPYIAGRRDLIAEVLDSAESRSIIADQRNMTVGELLRCLNDTAPLDDPLAFVAFGHPYRVVAMRGVCDDYHGERYAKFGDALVLRVYLAAAGEIPQWVFESADWNFMDAGQPGFLGYMYGSIVDDTIFLSGIQSDLAARYSYVLQGRCVETEIRTGDTTAVRKLIDSCTANGEIVRCLRRIFQRRWIEIFVHAIAVFMEHERLRKFAIQQFALSESEAASGHQMSRIYRALPQKLRAKSKSVRTADRIYNFAVCDFDAISEFIKR